MELIKVNRIRSKSEINLQSIIADDLILTPIPRNYFNENKKNEEIKNLLKEVLYNSLAQAIIKIILTPHFFLKIILLLFVLGTSGYTSYLVIQSIVNYFNYEVTTSSRTIYEMPTLFPKVTFCNVNAFTTEYAYNLVQQGITDFSSLSFNEKKKLGHDLNDTLIKCKFNHYECDSSYFIWSFDEFFGNCFTFNSRANTNVTNFDLKSSTLSGQDYGFQLILYVNVYEKLLCRINNFGVVIRIGNSSYETFYSYGEGILVSAGFLTYLAVNREFKSALPKPYSNCDINSNSPNFIQDLDLYNLIIQSGYEYTQQLCFYQCYQNHVINKYVTR